MPSPRTSLTAVATALTSVGVAVGSGTSFSSQAATFHRTATSAQTNSRDGLAIVTGTNMNAGDVRRGEVTIANPGSVDRRFVLMEQHATNTFSSGSLQLRIDDLTRRSTLYSGDLGRISAAGVPLGVFAAGSSRRYRFTTTLKRSATNADQGRSAAADYVWGAYGPP